MASPGILPPAGYVPQDMHQMTAALFPVPGEPNPTSVPTIGLWPGYDPSNTQQYRINYAANPSNYTPSSSGFQAPRKVGAVGMGTMQPPPPASGGSLPYVASSLIPRAPSGPDLSGLTYLGSPGANIGEFTIPNFQPTSSAPVTTGVTKSSTLPNPYSGYLQGSSLPLDTSGGNPYLTDPLMASYYGMQNPNFQQSQQDFYGDPELYSAPSVGRATGGG